MAIEFEGVKVFKKQGNTGAVPNTDAQMILAVSVTALPADFTSNDAVETVFIGDAEAVGIDASYDANNDLLAHYHIEEFYRYAPKGKLLVILTTEVTAAAFFAQDAIMALFKEYGSYKRAGFVYNGEPLDLDLDVELAACQTFIDDLATDHYLLDGIYLEGRDLGSDAADKRALTAPNCHVVIAQDLDIAAIDAAYAKYAAVGSVLGMRAVRKPNEHLGSTDIITKPSRAKADNTYPLDNPGKQRWLNVGLSDGTNINTLVAAQKQQLTDRGYIYAANYAGFPGFYFNGEPTAVAASSDYAWGENNNIWNKAARGIRNALLPKVKSNVFVDPDSGDIKNTSAKYLEGIAEVPMNKMLGAEEISGFTITIPTDQQPDAQTPLVVEASVTRNKIVHVFEVNLGLN